MRLTPDRCLNFAAPQGRPSVAQGETLGLGTDEKMQPRRVDRPTAIVSDGRPSRACWGDRHVDSPRVAPWATDGRPYGAAKNDVTAPLASMAP